MILLGLGAHVQVGLLGGDVRGGGVLGLAEAAGVVACEYTGAATEEDEDSGGVGFDGCELEGELEGIYVKPMFRVMSLYLYSVHILGH